MLINTGKGASMRECKDCVALWMKKGAFKMSYFDPNTSITIDLKEDDIKKLYQVIKITGQKNAAAAVARMISDSYYRLTLCGKAVYSEKLPQKVYLARKTAAEDAGRTMQPGDFQLVLNAVSYVQYGDPALYAALSADAKKELLEFRDTVILKAAEAVKASRSETE